mmetsp:Transcript_124791/g.349571  ORF Transcript_124791/g.349571 Transcript_124791/m.349571 type:complete len:202 (-) Transcript_124791:1099-1704(-)
MSSGAPRASARPSPSCGARTSRGRLAGPGSSATSEAPSCSGAQTTSSLTALLLASTSHRWIARIGRTAWSTIRSMSTRSCFTRRCSAKAFRGRSWTISWRWRARIEGYSSKALRIPRRCLGTASRRVTSGFRRGARRTAAAATPAGQTPLQRSPRSVPTTASASGTPARDSGPEVEAWPSFGEADEAELAARTPKTSKART